MATRTASKFASEGAARWLDAASMEPKNATAADARRAHVARKGCPGSGHCGCRATSCHSATTPVRMSSLVANEPRLNHSTPDVHDRLIAFSTAAMRAGGFGTMRPSLKAARNSRTAASVTAPSCNNVAAVSRRSWWPASRQVNDTSAISCPNVRASLPPS
eukprot:6481652-Lingulodinium_polyedra.AAC.2